MLVRHRDGRSAKEGLVAVVLLAGLAGSADALPFNQQQTQPQPTAAPDRPAAQRATRTAITTSRDKSAGKESPEALAPKAKGLLSIYISIDKQQLTLYSDGQPVAHSRVSTGVPGHPTPTGVFSIIQKDRYHHSNIYSNAPMYFMQRITWSGVAMHQGVVPNHPASHGCIRLPEAFARQLWGITRLGVRVILARGEVTPVAIAHPRLFIFKPAPPPEPAVEIASEPGASSSETVKAAYGALEVAGRKGDRVASDAVRPGNPALDAMAYAMVKPRETPLIAPEVKARGARAPASTGVSEVRPLKPGPIAVFVSRREGKVFVRKGFEPLFSEPVTFAEPDRPIGTHVYTALAMQDDNTTMRWNVVSMAGTASIRKPEKGKKAEPAPKPVGPASTAAEALDRVTIPQAALDRISELMSPGASLIISDQGLGPETGVGTDFIVLAR